MSTMCLWDEEYNKGRYEDKTGREWRTGKANTGSSKWHESCQIKNNPQVQNLFIDDSLGACDYDDLEIAATCCERTLQEKRERPVYLSWGSKSSPIVMWQNGNHHIRLTPTWDKIAHIKSQFGHYCWLPFHFKLPLTLRRITNVSCCSNLLSPATSWRTQLKARQGRWIYRLHFIRNVLHIIKSPTFINIDKEKSKRYLTSKEVSSLLKLLP